MPVYLGPDSEHVRRYLRVVLWRRRVEAARARADGVRREARLLVGFSVAFAVLFGLGPHGGWVRWLTMLGLAYLLGSEWRAWWRRSRRARRRVAEAEARLTAVRRARP